MNHGTRNAYEKHLCRCEPCTAANRDARRAQRAAAREANPAEPVKPGPKPRPRFENRMGNLRHAMTIEEWQAREAADPERRPETQGPMQLRAERMSAMTDGLTPFERIIAEGTL